MTEEEFDDVECGTSMADAVSQIMADLPTRRRVQELYRDLGEAWDTPRKWSIIREYYRLRAPHVIECDGQFDPYELGLDRFWTPIERNVWSDIRCMGLPFCMQYPVGRRFVDFGDPKRRIYIEADGGRWHDPERDAQKDAELEAAGWRGFRIKGRDTYRMPHNNIMRDVARWYGIDYQPVREEQPA